MKMVTIDSERERRDRKEVSKIIKIRSRYLRKRETIGSEGERRERGG